MISLTWIVLLHVFASSEGDCVLEHDDALLLQTKAVTQTISKKTGNTKALHVHRFRIDVQEHSVSLLQGHLEGEHTSVVYSICAIDDSGITEEFHDDGGAQVDTCGEMEITDEAGDVVDHVNGCAPESVPEGACYIFSEIPDWSIEDDSLYTVETHNASNTSDVVLVEIPNMDESKLTMAQEEVAKKTQDYPGSPVLLIGSGAKNVLLSKGMGNRKVLRRRRRRAKTAAAAKKAASKKSKKSSSKKSKKKRAAAKKNGKGSMMR